MPSAPHEARWRFIRAVRMIIMQNTMSAMAELGNDNQVLSFISHNDGSGQPEELTFDKKYFRARRETRITQNVKNILSLEAEERRPDQLKLALKGLQSISSFAEYPLHLQEKLVQVAYFCSIPQQKVIIRQGHIAENFYFLISGAVSVMKIEAHPITLEATSTKIGRFRKGDCFGEIELLHSDKRPYTITAEIPCQLIAIEKEDFLDMFMGDGESGREYEHLPFLRGRQFLKGWPVQILREHPQMCLFHFFKRGSVVVRDSNQSDWLYIIKSGSCQVIKKLRDTKPARRCSLPNTPQPDSKQVFTPRDGVNIGSKVDSRRRRASIASMTSSISSDDAASLRLKRRPSPRDEAKSGENAVFVQIDMLHTKDVFGLPMMCREYGICAMDQPSVSLVSRGAECIMLNKKFFVDHASEFVYRHIKEMIRPYPLAETLQEHLRLHTDWTLYKKQALSDVVAKSSPSSLPCIQTSSPSPPSSSPSSSSSSSSSSLPSSPSLPYIHVSSPSSSHANSISHNNNNSWSRRKSIDGQVSPRSQSRLKPNGGCYSKFTAH